MNPNWRSYHIPTIVDAPTINSEFVCHPEPAYFYGWKGLGELPHVQAPPAVLAAVRAATGLDLPAAPATPDYVSGVLDADRAMALDAEPGDGRRGPWKAPPPPRDNGPWAASPVDRGTEGAAMIDAKADRDAS
jgi:hypothetical protein